MSRCDAVDQLKSGGAARHFLKSFLRGFSAGVAQILSDNALKQ
jgi:hypothetical protein